MYQITLFAFIIFKSVLRIFQDALCFYLTCILQIQLKSPFTASPQPSVPQCVGGSRKEKPLTI